MTTTPTLNPSERDALYQSIVVRLTGINDVYDAVDAGDFETADRLTREFADYLRLIQDLGWGEAGEAVVLTTPPDVLHRSLTRLNERAETEASEEAAERREFEDHALRNRRVREVCSRELAQLEDRGGARPLDQDS